MRKYLNKTEGKTVAIDFDGVIHKSSKGFHDGTIYDDPIPGSLEAIKQISQEYEIVVYTCKAKKDRPLVQGKTGIQLVEEWLVKHKFSDYIKEVTSDKPRAFVYIDDRAIEFTDWKSAMEKLNEKTN